MHHAALIRQSGNMQHDRPSLGSLPRTGPLVPTDHRPGLCNSHDQDSYPAGLAGLQVWANCNTASTNDRRVLAPVPQCRTCHLAQLASVCSACIISCDPAEPDQCPLRTCFTYHPVIVRVRCKAHSGTASRASRARRAEKSTGTFTRAFQHYCDPSVPIRAHPCPYGTCSVLLYLCASVP